MEHVKAHWVKLVAGLIVVAGGYIAFRVVRSRRAAKQQQAPELKKAA